MQALATVVLKFFLKTMMMNVLRHWWAQTRTQTMPCAILSVAFVNTPGKTASTVIRVEGME